MLGYVGKKTDGSYAPFHWKSSLPLQDVEISDDIFLIQGELAEAYKAGNTSNTTGTSGATGTSTTNWHPRHDWHLRRDWHLRCDWHLRKHSSPRVEWRHPTPKVDELLHEGAF
jgi:hypothetical protein